MTILYDKDGKGYTKGAWYYFYDKGNKGNKGVRMLESIIPSNGMFTCANGYTWDYAKKFDGEIGDIIEPKVDLIKGSLYRFSTGRKFYHQGFYTVDGFVDSYNNCFSVGECYGIRPLKIVDEGV